MNDKTREILKKSGWSNVRRIDSTKFLIALKEEGYKCNQEMLSIIENIGDLVVCLGYDYFTFDFDIIYAVKQIFREVVEEYEERVNEELIVIGKDKNNFTILLSSTGRLYGGFDEQLIRYGKNLDESLDSLCKVEDYSILIA